MRDEGSDHFPGLSFEGFPEMNQPARPSRSRDQRLRQQRAPADRPRHGTGTGTPPASGRSHGGAGGGGDSPLDLMDMLMAGGDIVRPEAASRPSKDAFVPSQASPSLSDPQSYPDNRDNRDNPPSAFSRAKSDPLSHIFDSAPSKPPPVVPISRASERPEERAAKGACSPAPRARRLSPLDAFAHVDASASDSASESDFQPAGGWACSRCTFINATDVARCEMCDTPQKKNPRRPPRKRPASSRKSPSPPPPSVPQSKFSWKESDDDADDLMLAPSIEVEASRSPEMFARDVYRPPGPHSKNSSGSVRFPSVSYSPRASPRHELESPSVSVSVSRAHSLSGFGTTVSHSSDGLDVVESPKDVDYSFIDNDQATAYSSPRANAVRLQREIEEQIMRDRVSHQTKIPRRKQPPHGQTPRGRSSSPPSKPGPVKPAYVHDHAHVEHRHSPPVPALADAPPVLAPASAQAPAVPAPAASPHISAPAPAPRQPHSLPHFGSGVISEFDPFAESVAGSGVAQMSSLNGDDVGLSGVAAASGAGSSDFSLLDTFADLGLSDLAPHKPHPSNADREPQQDQPSRPNQQPPPSRYSPPPLPQLSSAGVPRMPDIDHEPIHVPANNRAQNRQPQRPQPRVLRPLGSSDHAPPPKTRSSPSFDTGVFDLPRAVLSPPASRPPPPMSQPPDDQLPPPAADRSPSVPSPSAAAVAAAAAAVDPFSSISNIFPQSDDFPSASPSASASRSAAPPKRQPASASPPVLRHSQPADDERSEASIQVDTSQRDAYRRQLEQANADRGASPPASPSRNRRSMPLRDADERKRPRPHHRSRSPRVDESFSSDLAHANSSPVPEEDPPSWESLLTLEAAHRYESLPDADRRALHDHHRLNAAIDRARADLAELRDRVRRRRQQHRGDADRRRNADVPSVLFAGSPLSARDETSLQDALKSYYHKHIPRPRAPLLDTLHGDFDARLRSRRRGGGSPRNRPAPTDDDRKRQGRQRPGASADAAEYAGDHAVSDNDPPLRARNRPLSQPQHGDRDERTCDRSDRDGKRERPRVGVQPAVGRHEESNGRRNDVGANHAAPSRDGAARDARAYVPPPLQPAPPPRVHAAPDFAARDIQQQMAHLQRNYAARGRAGVSPRVREDLDPKPARDSPSFPQEHHPQERERKREIPPLRRKSSQEHSSRALPKGDAYEPPRRANSRSDRDQPAAAGRRRSTSPPPALRARSDSRERRRTHTRSPSQGDRRRRRQRRRRRDSSPLSDDSGDVEGDSGDDYSPRRPRRRRHRGRRRGGAGAGGRRSRESDYSRSPSPRRRGGGGGGQRAPVVAAADNDDGGPRKESSRETEPTIQELRREVAEECAETLDSLSEVETQRLLSMVQQMWDGVYTPQRVRKYLRNVLPFVAKAAAAAAAAAAHPPPPRATAAGGGKSFGDRTPPPAALRTAREENANPEQAAGGSGSSAGGSGRRSLDEIDAPPPRPRPLRADAAAADIDDSSRRHRPAPHRTKHLDNGLVRRIVVHALGGQRAANARSQHPAAAAGAASSPQHEGIPDDM